MLEGVLARERVRGVVRGGEFGRRGRGAGGERVQGVQRGVGERVQGRGEVAHPAGGGGGGYHDVRAVVRFE